MKPSFTRKHENRRSSSGIRRGVPKKGDRPLSSLECWWRPLRGCVGWGQSSRSPFLRGRSPVLQEEAAQSGFTRETALSTGIAERGSNEFTSGTE